MLKATAKLAMRTLGLNRANIAAARMAVERNALARLPRQGQPRRGGRILCYHSIGQPATGVNDVAPDQLRRQLRQAQDMGYEFVPASEIAATGGSERQLAITFDDAWTSVAEYAAPILREMDLHWTLFVVSDWSEHRDDWTKEAILNWSQVSALRGSDMEIGSHSVSHPDFGKLDDAETTRQLFESRDMIKARLGFTPTTFAIPLGQSKNWTATAQATAIQAGYEYVYAQAEETRVAGTVARTFVTRFDDDRIFAALLNGAFDRWEEWA